MVCFMGIFPATPLPGIVFNTRAKTCVFESILPFPHPHYVPLSHAPPSHMDRYRFQYPRIEARFWAYFTSPAHVPHPRGPSHLAGYRFQYPAMWKGGVWKACIRGIKEFKEFRDEGWKDLAAVCNAKKSCAVQRGTRFRHPP